MADDAEVVRQVWFASLPVVFSLARNDVHAIQEPEPYHLMVPRLTYFPLVLDKVLKHFGGRHQNTAATVGAAADAWLEFEGTPLRAQLPVGVLFDLYASGGASLPWSLELHLSEFPDATLCRLDMQSAFMSALKEADHLKHRSQVVSGMQKKDHSQLWAGIVNHKLDQFWTQNRKLMVDSDFRYIPFRLYDANERVTQRLVKPKRETGEWTTLADLCAAVGVCQPFRLTLHGIEPPLETPLQWLSENMSYCDNFLHIVVKREPSAQ